jgi:mutator protein MutT
LIFSVNKYNIKYFTFQTLFMKDCSAWVIIDNNKRILLAKRSKDKTYFPNHWAIAWGNLELNETPEDAVIREIQEELWIKAIVKRFIGEYTTPSAHFYNFLLEIKEEKQKIVLNEENDGYWYFTYDETKLLLIPQDQVTEIIEKLHDEGLI